MNCPTCTRPNPEDARLCIYCATPLEAQEQPPVAEASTCPTVLLDTPATTPATAPAPPTTATQPRPIAALFPAQRTKEITGAIWLIGLGVLFLTHTFWPGILVLAGLTAYLQEPARGRQQEAVRERITLTGVALLFWTGPFRPGILILLGVAALLRPQLRRRWVS